MIGTTFKLGFEDGAVRRGLRGIGGLMGKFGKNVGIGLAQRVGHQMTDIFGRIIMAAPEALKETLDWAGGLTDMSTKTGVAVDELVLLEEKLRLAGVQANDTSKLISVLADSIFEATGPSPDLTKIEAFERLGMMVEDLDGKNVMQVFDMITKSIQKGNFSIGELETTMADIFGAKLGYELLKFAKDAEAITAQAKNNVGALATAMGESAGKLDQMGDALGRFENFKKSLASIALEEVANVLGAGAIDNMFDTFDPEKLRPKIREIISDIQNFVNTTLLGPDGSIGKWIKTFGKDLGNVIGEGIKESFGISSKGGGKMDFLKGLFGMSGQQAGIQSDPALKETNRYLSELVRKDTSPRYA